MLRIKNLIQRNLFKSRLVARKPSFGRLSLTANQRYHFSTGNDSNKNDDKDDENQRRKKENQKKREEFENWIYDQLNINAWSNFKKRFIGGTVLGMLLCYLFAHQIEFLSMNTFDESDFWEQINLNNVQYFEVASPDHPNRDIHRNQLLLRSRHSPRQEQEQVHHPQSPRIQKKIE